MSARPTSIPYHASRFAVWRIRRLHGSDLTYAEVASETGLPVATVKRICVEKGWRFNLEDEALLPVDIMMAVGLCTADLLMGQESSALTCD